MLNATRQFTVSAVDAGIRPAVASAISKYHLTEGGRVAINQAMDVHAGRGIIMGPNNYLARAYQGAPVGITVEGANILTRNLMIFGQGAMRCHPYIRAEYESLMNADGMGKFDDVMFRHIGYSLQTRVHSVFHSLTSGIFARGYSASKFNSYYKQITRLSSNFAHISDMSLIFLGGDIKRKERISARLGDAMSFLYMACASLKYYEDNGKRESDDIFLTWVLEHCLFNAQESLINVLDNYPLSKLAKGIKFVLFPYGKPFKMPSDKLEHKMSVSMLGDGGMRSVFKAMCYVPLDINDPVGRMEVAFQAVLLVEPVKVKIRLAIKAHKLPKAPYKVIIPRALEAGVITQTEADDLQKALQYTNDVIQVDEFKPFELGPKNAHPDWHPDWK
jgi:acyl-CoA dehydrogenase